MNIKGHGNGIAIALAGLAVVIAATGTAYAVTTTTVKIADGAKPSRLVHVDSSGRLMTGGSLSSLSWAGYLVGFQQNQYTYVTSPTTASLALSRIRLSNPALNGTNKEQVALYKVAVDGTGACTSSQVNLLGYYDLAAGQDVVDPLVPPLLVRATAGAKYCLAFRVTIEDTTPPYYTSYSITGYAAAGTYSGIGKGAQVVARSPKIRRGSR